MIQPTITITAASDDRFCPGLQVMLATALAAASGDYDYQIFVIDGGIDLNDWQDLENVLQKIASRKKISVSLERLLLTDEMLTILPQRRGSHLTYARLALPLLLPNVHEVIYLDSDVICFVGVEKIHTHTLKSGDLISGTLDYFDCIEKDCPWLEQLSERERKLPYVNTGIIKMNLQAMRETQFTEQAVQLVKEKPTRFADQTVINFLCRGKVSLFDKDMNYRPRRSGGERFLHSGLDMNIHLIGVPKPWLGKANTVNFFPSLLWYQAYQFYFGKKSYESFMTAPDDRAKYAQKAFWYRFFSPKRAKMYRSLLEALSDPGDFMEKALQHWRASIHES